MNSNTYCTKGIINKKLLQSKKVDHFPVVSFLRKSLNSLASAFKKLHSNGEILLYFDPYLFFFTERIKGKEFKKITTDIKEKIKLFKASKKPPNGILNFKDFWSRNGIDESFMIDLPDEESINYLLKRFNRLELDSKELIKSFIESKQEQLDKLVKLWEFLVDIYLAQVEYFKKVLNKDQIKKNIMAVLKPNLRKKMHEILQSELEYLMQCQASNKSEFYLQEEEKIKQLLYFHKNFNVNSKLPKRFRSIEPAVEGSDIFSNFLLKQSLSLCLESIGTLDLLLESMKNSETSFVILQFIYPGIPKFNRQSKTFIVVSENPQKQYGYVTVCEKQQVSSSDFLASLFNSNGEEATKIKEERNYANLIIASSLFIISLLLLSLSALYYNSRGIHNFFKGNPIKICLNIVLILLPIISFAGIVFAFKSSKSLKKVLQHETQQVRSDDESLPLNQNSQGI